MRYLIRDKSKISYLLLGLIFVLGVFIRTNLYLHNIVLEDDECRLTIALFEIKNIFAFFLPLDAGQSAPPLFIICTKFITYIAGFKEHIAKFIPFVSSIAAIFFFYKCCVRFFTKPFTQLAALFIFVISQPLIAFSSVFKQYSTDVLIACLCLYYLPQVRIKELSRKAFAGMCFALCALPLISLPSLFFIGAFLIKNVVFNVKDKKFLSRLAILIIPFAVVLGLYYFFNLAPSKANLYKYFPDYWDAGFFSFSLKDFLRFLVLNIRFYFVPNDFSLPAIVLFLAGIYLFCKEKSGYILYVLLLVLLAAFTQLYPLSGRVGLYFIPVIIIFVFKPLEVNNKYIRLVVLAMLVLSFCKYNLSYFRNITNFEYFVSYSPQKPMEIIKEKFNPAKDIVICNSASSSSYIYYSSKLGFVTDNIYEMPIKFADEENVFKYLNSLESGHNYWFYMIKDYNNFKIYPYILKWLENENVKYSFHERGSYLFYIEK